MVAGENMRVIRRARKTTIIHKIDCICLFSKSITSFQTLPRMWNFEQSLRQEQLWRKALIYVEKHDYT